MIKLDVNSDTIRKKCENCGVKYKHCDCFLEYTNFKDDLAKYKCLSCNKIYQEKFEEKLKEILFYFEKVFEIFTVSCKIEDVTDADFALAKRVYIF